MTIYDPYIAASREQQKLLRVFVDVDGVVADFADSLIREIGASFAADQWDIFSLMSEQQKLLAKKILKDPQFWQRQPVLPGAAEGVSQLLVQHDVYWATSPWLPCIGWGEARRAWLKKHFGVPPDRVVILTNKGLLGGDVLIDDKPANLGAWSRSNPVGQAILFDAPHNSCDNDWTRTGWDEIPDMLRSAIG